MTFLPPEDRGKTAGAVLDETMVLYETASKVLSQVVEEATGGDPKKVREVGEYAREMNRVLQVVLTERAKLDSLRRKDGGIVHDYALDFDAARDEIGRRLACLRDAGGGG